MEILRDINFHPIPNEITRNNWIVGSYFDMTNDVFYELHFCNDDAYFTGLLIDDTWAQSLYDVSAKVKKDIYILINCRKIDDFQLKKEYCYFLKCKTIQKTFFLYDELDDTIKNKVDSHKGLKSSYDRKSSERKLSLVTTVYNNAVLLEQTIQSVINQRSNRFEYIIKDACSTDCFKNVVKEYESFDIRVIESKDNGIYDGMNQGFVAASGDYLQILNSDDVFYNSEVVGTYISAIDKNIADAYCSDILLCFPDGKKIIRKPNWEKARYRSCINHTSLVLKKSDYFKLGGFDSKLKIVADCELTVKMIKAGLVFKRIPITCVNFRAGGASGGFTWNQLREGLVCRYRYHIFNIDGYVYTILQFLKNKFLK